MTITNHLEQLSELFRRSYSPRIRGLHSKRRRQRRKAQSRAGIRITLNRSNPLERAMSSAHSEKRAVDVLNRTMLYSGVMNDGFFKELLTDFAIFGRAVTRISAGRIERINPLTELGDDSENGVL